MRDWFMAKYTLKAIMENFEALLMEMPFQKVTVSALVELKNISMIRTVFWIGLRN